MITSDIINKFNLYVDDGSELSSSEELTLAEKIYRKVLDEHRWEFLKKEYSGTASTSVPYIALPSDFKNIAINYTEGGEPKQVIFLAQHMMFMKLYHSHKDEITAIKVDIAT